MAINKIQCLADDITNALASYMGLPDFATDSPYPRLAGTFAALVHTSEVNKGFCGPAEVAANAQEFTQHLASLINNLAEIVE